MGKNKAMKKTYTFYAVVGGREIDCMLARGNFDLRKDAIAEAEKHKCAVVHKITEYGPRLRDKQCVKVIDGGDSSSLSAPKNERKKFWTRYGNAVFLNSYEKRNIQKMARQ